MSDLLMSGAPRRGAAVVAVVAMLGAGLLGVPGGSAAATTPTLVQAFDNVGITAPGHSAPGDLDGAGGSFSSGAAGGLAADALTPGGRLLHDGLHVTWPDVAPGHDDNVVTAGQTISLTGKGNTLGVVATAVSAAAGGTFTVTYADGTTTSGTLTFSPWTDTSAATGTDILATTSGSNAGGTGPVSLFYGSLALDASKTVKTVTLPDAADLHVFDLTVGTSAAQATGGPGDASYYDQGRKDCVGTAADTESKTWFTVADGTLSDVYDPTIDNTDVKTLDPIVTGSGFTALQPRDMTYTAVALGSTGMACRIVATDSAHDFAVVSDFVTDPTTDAVVVQESLVRLPGAPSDLQVYLRFNPLLNGHGGGGTDNAGGESATVVHTARGPIPLSYSTNSFTEATNRTYATPIYAALSAATPFTQVETGYEGTASDGLSELDTSGALTTSGQDADNGNVVQTVALSFKKHAASATTAAATGAYGAAGSCGTTRKHPTAGDGQISAAGIAASVGVSGVTASDVSTTTVALGFATNEYGALRASERASAASFAATFARYQAEWIAYDQGLCAPPSAVPDASAALDARLPDAYWLSANVIKASEDKTFPGYVAAGLASPWGQSVPAGASGTDGLAPYFGSYREMFERDAYETFTGFLTDGDLKTARQIARYFFKYLQLPDGGFPRNGLLNGEAAPDTGGTQLDETADPILAVWQSGLGGDKSLYPKIRAAGDFLVANGPTDGVERWEEQTGYSPSTLADVISGLVAASVIAKENGDPQSARLFAATADYDRAIVLATTVTTNGPLSSQPYFIRVDKTGDPNEAYDYTVGNGDPTEFDQRAVIDQGFVELLRQGVLSLKNASTRALIANSIKVVDTTITVNTPSGTGIMRYNGDGYGDCVAGTPTGDTCSPTGAPWAPTDTGTGHPWPVLSGENAEYQLAAGDANAADSDLTFMLNATSGIGLEPEQVWDAPDLAASAYGSDPLTASIGFVDGKPDGSASPLTWAEAQVVRLIRDLGAGKVLERPSIVAARYAHPPATAPLTVTAPLAVSGDNVPVDLTRPSVTVDAAATKVSGTTTPGAKVDIAQTGTAPGATAPTTKITTVKATSTGAFTATLTLPPGSDAVEVATTTKAGATDEAVFTVDQLNVPGTVVLDVAGATGGGNGGGPGTTGSSGYYAYPTATNTDGSAVFAPGSFRLDELKVIDSGSTTTFQIGIANLVSTFGSLDGAQLFDLYIHAPGASTYSTASAGGTDWNYGLSSSSAWSQLIEVDGFGTDDWVAPTSSTSGLSDSSSIGTPEVSVAQLPASSGSSATPGLLSITVPTKTLGTVGAGWTFTVALAGQNGEGGIDDARGFTATPGAYTFGVCSAAEAGADPEPAFCAQNPADVPIIMDTIPPADVNVQTELNPLDNPSGVALQGVTVSS